MADSNQNKKPKSKVKVRKWHADDIKELVALQRIIYPDTINSDKDELRIFRMELAQFPEGQVIAEIDGKIVGYACSIIVQLDDTEEYYKYSEITGDGSFSTHNPAGDTLYGADIAVRPEYRGQGIAGLLYKERFKIMARYNLRRMVAHGRLPGYGKYAGKLTAEEYVQQVCAGVISDPALKAHLKAGYKVKRILMDHLVDRASLNYTTWLEMLSPRYSEAKRRIAVSPIKRYSRHVRACAAQYEFRKIKDWAEFEDSVNFFIETADTYHSHLLVFPELFTAQLFSTFDPKLSDQEAIDKLADLSEKFVEFMSAKSKAHNIYIVGGTTPVRREGKLYNTSYFFTPGGKVYFQDKLHITPTERTTWSITPGEAIKVFDTPIGRIGIVVCYDIEFPEICRIMVEHGVEIIACPFSTDERKAFNRVRFCASARAVENYVYIVMAGNVGNLHSVRSYLINYGQSAILTPSDFAFPVSAVAAECDPNTETVALADLDITALLNQREIGTVRPFYDQRRDLYEIICKIPVEFTRID